MPFLQNYGVAVVKLIFFQFEIFFLRVIVPHGKRFQTFFMEKSAFSGNKSNIKKQGGGNGKFL